MGEALTSDTSDLDGLTIVSYGYQWLADGVDIAWATGPIHTLTGADEGKVIRVWVSFTDDAGNEESLSSEPTGAVAVPLNGNLHDNPENRNGSTGFSFELRFSEEVRLNYKKLRDQALLVTGGTVQRAHRLEKPGNTRGPRWCRTLI